MASMAALGAVLSTLTLLQSGVGSTQWLGSLLVLALATGWLLRRALKTDPGRETPGKEALWTDPDSEETITLS